jgi:hypothetical protein
LFNLSIIQNLKSSPRQNILQLLTYKRYLLHICRYVHYPYVNKFNISRPNKYMLNITTARILYVVQQPKSALGRPVIEVFRSYTVMTHSHPVGLLWTSDQLVADVTTYITNSKQERWTVYALSGIRTREPSNRAAADIQLRWHRHRDWHCTCLFSLVVLVIFKFIFFIIKPTRCTNFTNLFCRETLHVSDSSSVHHREFIHCTLSNGIWHTGL